MNKGMLQQLRKRIVWLLAALLVLGVLAGCAGNPEGTGSTVPTGQSGQVVTETDGQMAAEAGDEAAVGGQMVAETGRETAADSQAASAETGAEPAAETNSDTAGETQQKQDDASLDAHGSYTSKDQVALYLHTYGCLPDNYITKKEAESLGWDSKKGNLWEVAPGMSIGGSYFGNYEGQLPKKKGRRYYECDINYEGGYRGAERIIYSDDGLIFYTGDHYENFEQLYPE